MSAKSVSFLCIAVVLFSVAFAVPAPNAEAPKAEAPKENMKTAETIYDWSPSIMTYYSNPAYAPLGYRTVLPLEYNSVYPSWLYKK